MDSTTRPIIEALESVAGVIAREHGIKNRISLVVGASGGGTKHGHFLARGWVDRDGNDVHEILMSGESLQRGAVATLGTMLHELAHLYNYENGIKDTSDSGRYHNTRFRKTAESFGLGIEQEPRIGHSKTSVPEATQRKFAGQVAALERAITAWRRPDLKVAASSSSKKFLFGCPECDDPVRVSKKWGEAHDGQYECGLHGEWLRFWEEGGES